MRVVKARPPFRRERPPKRRERQNNAFNDVVFETKKMFAVYFVTFLRIERIIL